MRLLVPGKNDSFSSGEVAVNPFVLGVLQRGKRGLRCGQSLFGVGCLHFLVLFMASNVFTKAFLPLLLFPSTSCHRMKNHYFLLRSPQPVIVQ